MRRRVEYAPTTDSLSPALLRTSEAARFLALSARTLEKHRCHGTGPKYRKLGGRVIHALADLKAWADRGIKESTSDPGSGTVVRWGSDDSGTIFSRIDIFRAVREDERYSTVPDVREILPRLPGWRKVVRVLEAIDIVDAGIDPADAAPEHRRHVQNERPRPYTQRVTKPGSGAER
jgi:hypothetical protein